MTEMIFSQGERDLKLTCTLHVDTLSVSARYFFKLMQRDKGKRKWQEIKGYEYQYRVTTDMEDILRYLPRSQVMKLAELEYKKYAPTQKIFNV